MHVAARAHADSVVSPRSGSLAMWMDFPTLDNGQAYTPTAAPSIFSAQGALSTAELDASNSSSAVRRVDSRPDDSSSSAEAVSESSSSRLPLTAFFPLSTSMQLGTMLLSADQEQAAVDIVCENLQATDKCFLTDICPANTPSGSASDHPLLLHLLRCTRTTFDRLQVVLPEMLRHLALIPDCSLVADFSPALQSNQRGGSILQNLLYQPPTSEGDFRFDVWAAVLERVTHCTEAVVYPYYPQGVSTLLHSLAYDEAKWSPSSTLPVLALLERFGLYADENGEDFTMRMVKTRN